MALFSRCFSKLFLKYHLPAIMSHYKSMKIHGSFALCITSKHLLESHRMRLRTPHTLRFSTGDLSGPSHILNQSSAIPGFGLTPRNPRDCRFICHFLNSYVKNKFKISKKKKLCPHIIQKISSTFSLGESLAANTAF